MLYTATIAIVCKPFQSFLSAPCIQSRNFKTFRAFAEAACHNCIVFVEPIEVHPLALWSKTFSRIDIRFRSLYGHRSVIRHYMGVGGGRTNFGPVPLRLRERCNMPGRGRQLLSLFLCLMAWLLWKLTHGFRYVFSFDLVSGALVYTLFWCYHEYVAVCIARIMVSVSGFSIGSRAGGDCRHPEVCMESVVVKWLSAILWVPTGVDCFLFV